MDAVGSKGVIKLCDVWADWMITGLRDNSPEMQADLRKLTEIAQDVSKRARDELWE